MLRVAVLGATGRMGQALLRLIAAAPDMELGGAATEPGHAALGEDAGTAAGMAACEVLLTDATDQALAGCDVAVDFSLPVAAAGHARACAAAGVPLVMGTTGLGAAEVAALDEAAQSVPVLYGRNMSLGVNLLTELVRIAAGALGPEYDVEIFEAHHREKLDAPSGTALQLGEAVAEGRGGSLSALAVYARHGQTGRRAPGSIGFASLRGGSLPGEHTVILAADEEVLELGHRALSRDVFARGALQAARWLPAQPPGRYGMRDLLGLAATG